MINVNPLLSGSDFICLVMLEEHSLSQQVCLCVTLSGARATGLWVGPTEDASSGSHLGSGGIALARCVFVCGRSVCLRIASFPIQNIFLSLFQSCRLPPPSPLPPSSSSSSSSTSSAAQPTALIVLHSVR